MTRNEGTVDRIIRIVVGVVLLVAGILGWVTGALMWVFIVIGAIALITGVIGWCGVYALFGISTYKAAPKAEGPPQEPKPAQ